MFTSHPEVTTEGSHRIEGNERIIEENYESAP